MCKKITLLGTGTCQLQKNRTSSSILVELDDVRFLYDIGRGTTQRLAELGVRQDDLEYIVLSHFHPDHISDLIPFLHAACWSQVDRRTRDLHIFGPNGLTEQLRRLLGLFGRDELQGEHFDIILHEISDTTFTIKDLSFLFSHLPPVNNSGLKFKINGKTYAFTGDSNYHEKEIHFLNGVDFAVIDAGHPTDDEIISLAVRTQVPTMVLSHLYRETDEVEICAKAKKAGYQGRLVVGRDLLEFAM